MLQKKPVVSIIMPAFNRASLISESLNSILAQTYVNWECIIVDDGSIDDTLLVVEKYIERDARFKIFKRPDNKNKGANSCRNYGLEKSKGEYIHWFDSDDIAHPDYLKISLGIVKEYHVDFCRFSRAVFRGKFITAYQKLDEIASIERVDWQNIEQLLKNELSFNTCNVLWRRSSLGAERFNENIVYADEWEYYSRLLSNNLKGVSIETILFFGRKHANSTTYEYSVKDPIRLASKKQACKLVIENLASKNLFTSSLENIFIRLGFELKSYEIIKLALNSGKASLSKKLKYRIGYEFYPVIRPIFKLKDKLKRA